MSNASRKITPAAAIAAIKEHGGVRSAARALGMDNGWLCRLAKRAGKAPDAKPDLRGGREAYVDEAASRPEEAYTGGISLSPSVRVLERRPPVTVRSKFFSLPKGKAFKIADLAKRWGFSAETVKRHAKDENCFGYVDTTGHDDFEECVMHPDTAEARMKGN